MAQPRQQERQEAKAGNSYCIEKSFQITSSIAFFLLPIVLGNAFIDCVGGVPVEALPGQMLTFLILILMSTILSHFIWRTMSLEKSEKLLFPVRSYTPS